MEHDLLTKILETYLPFTNAIYRDTKNEINLKVAEYSKNVMLQHRQIVIDMHIFKNISKEYEEIFVARNLYQNCQKNNLFKVSKENEVEYQKYIMKNRTPSK